MVAMRSPRPSTKRRVEDDPQDVVPDRPARWERAQVDEVRVGREEGREVVESDPVRELAAAPAVERQQDRVDRGEHEEDEEQDGGRPEEDEEATPVVGLACLGRPLRVGRRGGKDRVRYCAHRRARPLRRAERSCGRPGGPPALGSVKVTG